LSFSKSSKVFFFRRVDLSPRSVAGDEGGLAPSSSPADMGNLGQFEAAKPAFYVPTFALDVYAYSRRCFTRWWLGWSR
jgi:hypothetical protein